MLSTAGSAYNALIWSRNLVSLPIKYLSVLKFAVSGYMEYVVNKSIGLIQQRM